MAYSDDQLRRALTAARTVAVVGLSARPDRPSHAVALELVRRGYRVIPVNPGHAGERLFGACAVARLSDIPPEAGVDMVDIFRRPDLVGPVVDEALACLPALRTIWMQIGVVDPAAAARAEARGITVIMDRCPKIELRRLFGTPTPPDPATDGTAPRP